MHVRAMKSLNDDLTFSGIGDKELRDAGVEIIVASVSTGNIVI